MRALTCHRFGSIDDLAVDELPDAPLGPNDVRIRVAAAGVNFSDILVIKGAYQVRPALPFAAGCEVGGVISEVGRDVHQFAVGDRVIGLSECYGGFVSDWVISENQVISIPADVSLEAAAVLGTTYGTAHYALVRRGRVRAQDTLLVLGAAGGVGTAAIQIGKQLGARVIAAASSEQKLAFCARHGADAGINYRTEALRPRLRELTDGRGVDVVFDPVGGDAFDAASRAVARGGRYLVVGFASGRIPTLRANLVLLKSYDLVGVHWKGITDVVDAERNRRDIDVLINWYRSGRIAPVISDVYPLERGIAALRHVEQRRVCGRVVIAP